MPQPEKVLARIQSLDERLARLRTEKNRLIARAGHAERKRDTRRKILIGGAVLAAIDHEGVPVMRSVPDLLIGSTRSSRDPTIGPPLTCCRSSNKGAAGTLAFGDKSPLVRSEAAVKDARQPAPQRGAKRP